MIFPFKEKGFPRKSLCFLCGCASAVLAKISSLLYREFFQQKPVVTLIEQNIFTGNSITHHHLSHAFQERRFPTTHKNYWNENRINHP